MKIGGIPILNFIPWAIWIIGKRMGEWGWFPGFFIAMVASGVIHYLSYQENKGGLQ
jgi:hypothetical protein